MGAEAPSHPESLYETFLAGGGMEKLERFVAALRRRGKKADVQVIRFMDAFALAQSPAALLRAIAFGHRTIADSIYFENQILSIARQIVDMEEWTLDGDGDDADDGNSDVEEALLCLNEMRRSSSTLTKEEKAILGQAVRRIRGKSCACVIL